jgi:Amt family ammonium transporter
MHRISRNSLLVLCLAGFILTLAAHAGAAEIKPILAPVPAPAPVPAAAISAGDTAWMLGCTGLVLLMTPGLACFYGGLVRRKNVLGTMLQSFAAMGLIGVLWVFVEYTLCFGPTHHGLIGGIKYLFLNNVDGTPHPVYAPTTPHMAFMAYQGMFAIITPALIGGAVAERMKFSAYFWFIALWSLLVYAPLCHWIWADGGWMAKMGVLDFAGGAVVIKERVNSPVGEIAGRIVSNQKSQSHHGQNQGSQVFHHRRASFGGSHAGVFFGINDNARLLFSLLFSRG